MTSFLIRCFVRRPEEVQDATVRCAYGKLAGAAGLGANLLLFVLKLLAGLLSQSLAIMADAFNNLSDAGSSIVTLVGFRLSAAPPDREHPFGHGRMEYLSALAVAALIMVAGFELAVQSVNKILHPTETAFSVISLVILVVAIAVKLWMALFYHKIGVKIDSEALRAATADSRNDVLCTALVLACSVIGWQTGVALDGYVGTLVALFVIWSGFSVVRHTVSPLLGQAPDPQLVRDIRDTVLANEGVVGVHDLMVHSYGPGHRVISLHAEVPCEEDMLRSHDRIDRIEREISETYNALVCIHMDPVDTADERVARLRELAEETLHEVDDRLALHDFRVVFGETHTNLIFDVVVPFDYAQTTAALSADLQKRIQEKDDQLFVVATVEHSFT